MIFGTGRTQQERFSNLQELRQIVEMNQDAMIPAGDIEVELDMSEYRHVDRSNAQFRIGLLLKGMNRRIRGHGRGITRIHVWPRESPAVETWYFIYVDNYLAGCDIEMSDFTIIGPTGDPGDGDLLGKSVVAIRHQGWRNPETIRLERVNVTGHWHYSVQSSEGELLFDAKDCVFESSEITFGYHSNINTNKRLHLENCLVYTRPDEGDKETVACYISPNISGRFHRCHFLGNSNYALYWNGTATLPIQYADVSECVFSSGYASPAAAGRGIKAPSGCVVKVRGSSFNVGSAAINLWGDGDITTSSFHSNQPQSSITGFGSRPDRIVSIIGNRFASSAAGADSIVDCSGGGRWAVLDSTFNLSAVFRCVSTHGAVTADVHGCHFDGPTGSIGLSHSIASERGCMFAGRNRFRGGMTPVKWTSPTAPHVDSRLWLDDNVFEPGVPPVVYSLPGPFPAKPVIQGTGNRFSVLPPSNEWVSLA